MSFTPMVLLETSATRLVREIIVPLNIASQIFASSPLDSHEVDNKMTIAQEEIFGPVLSIIPYNSEEEPTKMTNGHRAFVQRWSKG